MPSSSDAGAGLAARIPAAARTVLEIAEASSSRAPELRARGVRVEARAVAGIAGVAPGAFDAVLLDGVLEGAEDPAYLLEQLAAALAPGGAAVASVPNVGHWSVILGLLGAGGEATPRLVKGPRRFFTRATLGDVFDAAGLEIVEVFEILRPAPPEQAAAVARLAAFPGASPDLDVAEFHVIARRAEV
ncbi:MAG TPA: methyltransferase domain-containing protein [Thermoanaerobaculia bacterium]